MRAGRHGIMTKTKPISHPFLLLLVLPVLALVLPLGDRWGDPDLRQWGVVLCLFAAMATGYFDDRADYAGEDRGRKEDDPASGGKGSCHADLLRERYGIA